jgi:competence protein ComEC
MVLFALAFVAGAWVLQQFSSLPSLYWAALLLPFLLCCRARLPRWPRRVNTAILAFLLGLFGAATQAHLRLADELPHDWEGRDIEVVGVVATMPQPQERGERFQFDVERILTEGAKVPPHISLTWYAENGTATERPVAMFHAGERWRFIVRLKRPHGTLNPHGFDFEAWALENNIRATGYVRQDAGNRRLESLVKRPAYLVEAVREHIRQRMQKALAEERYGGILQALAIGDEAAIRQDDWQTFLHTGTNHLMSISGLHITMLAGLAFSLAHALWRRSEKLVLTLPARKAATLAGALAALAYALIAGFSVPTQRTFFMLLVISLALWSSRNVSIARVLALAFLVVVVLDPWAVRAPGFWLSFGAVAIIAYAMDGRLQRAHWLRGAVHVQWAVSLGLIPLLLVMFHQVSVISPIANAFAIPLVSLVVVPLTLAGSLLPLPWPLNLAHEVMAIGMAVLEWLAALPVSIWQQHAPPVWTLPLALFGVCWVLLPRGFPMRWLGLVAMVPMLLLRPSLLPDGAMRVAVLDVGQGLAVVVRTASHALLYDAGPRYSRQSDSGGRIVVPFLRGSGIRRLDGMVVSHQDNDHAGGMQTVLAQMPVGWLASSLPAETEALAGVRHMACHAGQSWMWDGVRFEVLHPAPDSYRKRIKDNDRSCVLRVTSAYGSLLLPGDIERRVERALVHDAVPASDVLLVPHHGSGTSSTEAFIEQIRPLAAIFTVGYRNRFGHPKEEVVERYRNAGSLLYRTDFDGALLLDFDEPHAIKIRRWRQEARRYWHDAAPGREGLLAEIRAAR